MQETSIFVGVDVAKAELVTAAYGDTASGVIANECAAIEHWLASLPAGTYVAMESTGIYHRLLAERAHAAGMRVYVLNARDVYFYAKALGARGKTDRVDARLIARYVAEHHARLHCWQPGEGAQARIQELMLRRAQLVTKRVSMRQTLKGCSELSAQQVQLEQAFDELLQALDARVLALIEADQVLSAGRKSLSTITGFGPQASALLTAVLSRMQFANADALVAYSGLDPRANDSGTRRGRRRLSKRGPPALRRQMFLVAFAASHSKALKPLYQSIRLKGFASTQALVILARKLLRVAYAVYKSGKPFEPSRFLAKPA